MTKAYVPGFAVSAADSFREDALRFFDNLPIDPLEPHIGRMFSASTELILSLELYFKALHSTISRGRKVPPTHDLVILFDELPQPVQSQLSESYVQRTAAWQGTTGLSFIIGPSVPLPIPPPSDGPVPLRELLEANRTAFVKWRYMHEVRQGEHSTFTIDFFEINALCECVRELAEFQFTENEGLEGK